MSPKPPRVGQGQPGKEGSFYAEPMDKTSDLIMSDGNTAAAIGSVYGGVQFVGWYPITPATAC